MPKHLPLFLMLLGLLLACQPDQEKQQKTTHQQKSNKSEQTTKVSPIPREAPAYVRQTMQAHKVSRFAKKEAVAFHFNLQAGGNTRMDADIFLSTDTKYVKIVRKNGTTLLARKDSVFCFPPDSAYDRARFDALTWSYFFAAPYKLADPGTQWEDLGPQMLDSTEHQAAMLTFESGTGDSPDDWYYCFFGPDQHYLKAMGYIVTFGGKNPDKAKEHLIRYKDFQQVEGIPFATTWHFLPWSRKAGLKSEKPMMLGKISQVRFLSEKAADFSLPPNAKEIPLP